MGSMSLRKNAVLWPILFFLLASCVPASQKTIADLGAKYEKANQSAVDAVSVESKQVKRVRRIGAVIAYINNPSLSPVENLNAGEMKESFKNFVCTGEVDFQITSAGLKFTSDYAKTVKAITTLPDDSIYGYVRALSELKGKKGPLALPEIKKNQFSECLKEVEKDLPPTGYTAVTARREAVAEAIAAVEAVQALITSIQKLVKMGLKRLNEAEQIAVLKSFIEENKDNYQRVLTEDLSSDELKNAFERRRKIAVAAPYYAFEDMMKLSTTKDRREMIKRAVEIDQDLAEYDAIRIQRAPVAVAGQFEEINKNLKSFVEGKTSLAEIIQFLSETASELEDAKKNYDDVATKYQSLLDAIKKLE
jgi:hypothetical protein